MPAARATDGRPSASFGAQRRPASTRRGACGAAPCPRAAAGSRRRPRRGAAACTSPASRRRAARARPSATGRSGSSCDGGDRHLAGALVGHPEHRAVEHRRDARAAPPRSRRAPPGSRCTLIISFARSVRCTQPSGSSQPTSPVRYQPSANASAVGLVREVAGHHRRAPHLDLADLARRGSGSPVSRSTTRSSTPAGGRPAESSRHALGSSTGLHGDHRQLAGAVGGQPAHAGALGDGLGDALGHRRRAPHDVAQRRQVVVLERRVVGHAPARSARRPSRG